MIRTVDIVGLTLDRGLCFIEVKRGLRAGRSLRDALLSLSFKLAGAPENKAKLVLIDPRITDKRLEKELEALRAILQPEISSRLDIVVVRGDLVAGLSGDPPDEIRALIDEHLSDPSNAGMPLPRPDYFFEVLKVLVLSWISGDGPVTTRWIMRRAGCSYPTVAGALRRLGRVIRRSSDRKVELDRFPRDAWAELLVGADRLRNTRRFADRSGKPRSPDALQRRLSRIDRSDVAVGGVQGARHWHPELNLVGSPRLDLSIHCPDNRIRLDFIRRLDPALVEIDDPHLPHSLVVHAVRRADDLFVTDVDGLVWADPVECLLDLQELRLEKQANELVEALIQCRGDL